MYKLIFKLLVTTQNALKSFQITFSKIDSVMLNVEYQTLVLFCFQLRLLKTTTTNISYSKFVISKSMIYQSHKSVHISPVHLVCTWSSHYNFFQKWKKNTIGGLILSLAKFGLIPYFWSIMKMGIRKNIHNMFQGPPNPGFVQEKVQTGDFLKKTSRKLKFFLLF